MILTFKNDINTIPFKTTKTKAFGVVNKLSGMGYSLVSVDGERCLNEA